MKRSSATVAVIFLLASCTGQPTSPAPQATGTPAAPESPAPGESSPPGSEPAAFEGVPRGTELQAGTYVLHYASIGRAEDFPTLAITFTVPAGWDRVLNDGQVWNDRGMRLGFAVVDNLYVDPCDPNLGLRDPPVGSSVDDLATALGTVPGWDITEADHDLYFGYPAVRLVLSGPADVTSCPQDALRFAQLRLAHTLGFPGFIETVAEGERQELWILQVEGTRLVINAVSAPDASMDDLQELQAIVSSIQIQP